MASRGHERFEEAHSLSAISRALRHQQQEDEAAPAAMVKPQQDKEHTREEEEQQQPAAKKKKKRKAEAEAAADGGGGGGGGDGTALPTPCGQFGEEGPATDLALGQLQRLCTELTQAIQAIEAGSVSVGTQLTQLASHIAQHCGDLAAAAAEHGSSGVAALAALQQAAQQVQETQAALSPELQRVQLQALLLQANAAASACAAAAEDTHSDAPGSTSNPQQLDAAYLQLYLHSFADCFGAEAEALAEGEQHASQQAMLRCVAMGADLLPPHHKQLALSAAAGASAAEA